jgi:hydroxymethylbilane synthase
LSATLRIGTRGSALALAQAGWVAERVGGELVEITTAGDLNRAAGDKSRWTGALEGALLLGEIDLAVHSAKDVPSDLADGLGLVGAAARVDPADVLCGADSLEALPAGARIGTSALRRRAQLLAAREDVEVVELRGNVDTRLRKLADGEVDAVVLARAGLERLGRLAEAGATLTGELFVPAAGQGVLALEARLEDLHATATARAVHDEAAWVCLVAERALTRTLGADCHSAVGAHAALTAEGALRLVAFVGAPDGSAWLRDELTGDAADPEALGAQGARRLLSAGAAELLVA